MTEVILAITIIALLVFISWKEFIYQKEIARLTNAIISKNANEFKQLETNVPQDVNVPETQQIPTMIPVDQLSDDDFMEKVIKGEQ